MFSFLISYGDLEPQPYFNTCHPGEEMINSDTTSLTGDVYSYEKTSSVMREGLLSFLLSIGDIFKLSISFHDTQF